MSRIYIVTKRESGKYEEDGTRFSILAAFDTRDKTEECLKKYEKTAPRKACYTFYRIESALLFLSSHKVRINRPKRTTYPIGELVKLGISGEKQFKSKIKVSKKTSIKATEAQPLPCLYCDGFHGYQYSGLSRMSCTSAHNSNGIHSGGEYPDGVSLNKSKTAYCVNYGTKLPFILIRESEEQIE